MDNYERFENWAQKALKQINLAEPPVTLVEQTIDFIKQQQESPSIAPRCHKLIWGMGAVAASIIIAVTLITFLPTQSQKGESTYRSGSIVNLTATQSIAQAPERLSWKTVAGAERYRITFYETDLIELLTLESQEADILFPKNTKLFPATQYFWQVEAFDRDGTLIAVSERRVLFIEPSSDSTP